MSTDIGTGRRGVLRYAGSAPFLPKDGPGYRGGAAFSIPPVPQRGRLCRPCAHPTALRHSPARIRCVLPGVPARADRPTLLPPADMSPDHPRCPRRGPESPPCRRFLSRQSDYAPVPMKHAMTRGTSLSMSAYADADGKTVETLRRKRLSFLPFLGRNAVATPSGSCKDLFRGAARVPHGTQQIPLRQAVHPLIRISSVAILAWTVPAWR